LEDFFCGKTTAELKVKIRARMKCFFI